jgi:hypothetical protein
MKMHPVKLAVLLAASAALPLSNFAFGQGFASPGGMVDASGTGSLFSTVDTPSPSLSESQAGKLCAEGTRAIDQGRWADAVKLFSQVASAHGDHADAAYYWKAYAQNKLGQTKASVDSCKSLRRGFPKSKWVEDCGALEVELNARSGKPAEIDPNSSDDVKLLALNTMLRQDEPRALAEIQAILKGDSSEKLKKEAQFILGTHYSDSTYAQVVRLSYVEGDVRVQRGDPTGKPSEAVWEKAVSGLPVETGFSLVTGVGARAEIEFENASTVYLGENSVLTFNDLHETAGVPYTELGLLAGTMSLNFHPYVAWEKLVLHTPTSDFISKFPDKTYARIESFTDAVSITPLGGGTLRLPGVPRESTVPGRTWSWVQGQLVDPAGAPDANQASSWDKWVAGRVAQRNAAVQSVMAQSGLSEPIPGMADMAGAGKFFDCAPYGTCWEPNDQAGQGAGQEASAAMRRPSRPANQQPHLELAAYHPATAGTQVAQYGVPPAEDSLDDAFRFPCTPSSLLYRLSKDPVSGRTVVSRYPFFQSEPYDWAVCHAGSWIRHRKHYVWVAGTKRHHIDPVRWVKVGHTVAFVPIHPYDVKGQPAINAKHEVFTVNGKNQITVKPVKFDTGIPVEYLKDPPKEYRVAQLRPIPTADAPHMEVHTFNRAPGLKTAEPTRVAVPLHFDLKSQTFLIARQQVNAGKTATVYVPMTNRSGSLQARADSFGGASAFRGSLSSGSAGTSRGGGISGGGSRGGGGSSGGGGHASGGTSSVSSASSSSAAAASSSSAHH